LLTQAQDVREFAERLQAAIDSLDSKGFGDFEEHADSLGTPFWTATYTTPGYDGKPALVALML